MIYTENFGTYKNRKATLYVLKNEYLEVGVTDFGGVLQRFIVNTPDGNVDIACCTTSCEDYVNYGAHMGGTIGRVANRIADGKFQLNGKTYKLDINAGTATLHGGFNPYDFRFFDAEVIGDVLRLSLFSPDGDQGFPGDLEFAVEFSLDKNKLIIKFFGTAKDDTLFSPTNHVYFNLNGEGSGDIYNTLVQINADKVTLADDNLVVTGEVMNVKGTPFDFTEPKTIAPDIFADDVNVVSAGGFDHNFILNSNHVATCVGDKTGITLDMYTDLPGVQFYCGNMMHEIKGKSLYHKQNAFCLEPQYFPNAINVDGFEKPILKAGESVSHYIEYVLTCK